MCSGVGSALGPSAALGVALLASSLSGTDARREGTSESASLPSTPKLWRQSIEKFLERENDLQKPISPHHPAHKITNSKAQASMRAAHPCMWPQEPRPV